MNNFQFTKKQIMFIVTTVIVTTSFLLLDVPNIFNCSGKQASGNLTNNYSSEKLAETARNLGYQVYNQDGSLEITKNSGNKYFQRLDISAYNNTSSGRTIHFTFGTGYCKLRNRKLQNDTGSFFNELGVENEQLSNINFSKFYYKGFFNFEIIPDISL
jgi:hypothetical protein